MSITRCGIFRHALLVATLLGLTVHSAASSARAEALHEQIDRWIESAAQEQKLSLSPLADDAQFVRRIYLDLNGRIPTGEQVREFLAETSEDKRERLIDRLLAAPEYPRRMQYVFDTILMQRLPAKHVPQAVWQQYLYDSFRQNKSWQDLTEELLAADGADSNERPAARFLLDRELKPEPTVRSIGRVFLGRDLQCAQCHDHPQLDDYLQRHYFGIAAFFNRSYLFKDPKTKQTSLGEKAEGVVKFTSVFTGEEGAAIPQILDLDPLLDPEAEPEPYYKKPNKTTRGIPKYSRRWELAWAVTSPENRDFRRNIANRIWALMIGRGLVDPVDMYHEDYALRHKELLALLGDHLHDGCYDLRDLLREIALSRTYQRSSRFEGSQPPDPEHHAAGLLKPLTPEQLAWSSLQAVGLVEQTRVAELAKLKKAAPQGPPPTAFQVEQAVTKTVQPQLNAVVTVYAAGDSQRFDATAGQALFLKNSPLVSKWLQPAGDNLVARLAAIEDSGEFAEHLYLNLFSRLPDADESAAVADFLAAAEDQRLGAIQELVRALLCSAEFRFNH